MTEGVSVQVAAKPANAPWFAAETWWRSINADHGRGPDKGALRSLRHRTVTDVVIDPEWARLHGMMFPGKPFSEYETRASARVALVLCRVETALSGIGTPLGISMGRPTDTGRSPVSEIRFRDCILAQDDAAIVSAFSSAIEMIKGPINVANLAKCLILWVGNGSQSAKSRLAFDYYSNSPSK